MVHQPGPDYGAYAKRQSGPRRTAERRLTGWQRALRWAAWLIFLALAVYNSQDAAFSGVEWVALIAAVGISIWCMAKPLGGPKVALTEPEHLRGEFVSRTSWGLVLFGALLTVGGIGAGGAIAYDLATGRASVGDVLRDMAIFAEGWFVEVFTKGAVDAELENTHAYALVVLLLPGLVLLSINLGPFLRRGAVWRVESDGSVSVRSGGHWYPLLEYRHPQVVADGSTIRFAAADEVPEVVLPQQRVFSKEYDARLAPRLSAEFFGARLTACGFALAPESGGSTFVAQRIS